MELSNLNVNESRVLADNLKREKCDAVKKFILYSIS